MLKSKILSGPKYGWANFQLMDDLERDFYCGLSYVADVMFDFMIACKTFSVSRNATVELDCEGKFYLFVISECHCYIIEPIGEHDAKIYTFNIGGNEVCKNIYEEYQDNKEDWIKFAIYDLEDKEEYKKEKIALESLSNEIEEYLKRIRMI